MPPHRGLIAYFAPGGGMGHMNRAIALSLALRDAGADARIVTDSPFSPGLAALTRCPIVHLPREHWAGAARSFVEEFQPAVLVTDTFPYGLRDEWRLAPPAAKLVHVARRLLTPFPLRAADFSLIIQAEPLATEHRAALGGSLTLAGPILLAPGRVATPVPPVLDHDGLTLIVHSGPATEVAALIDLAARPFTVISPWSSLDYYPATNLYARARHIFTGAGYNSMADLLAHRNKHTALPFPRRFDDQHARVQHFFRTPADGTAQAVDAILSLL